MDLLSLYYFAELAKDLHITRTANRLFLSQQTLSSRLQRLEAHYGTPLLNRKPSLSLTYAGEQVLAFAQKVLKEEQELHRLLADIAREEQGAIRFGASVLRMNHSLPPILPVFAERHPKITLHLTNQNSAKLEAMVQEGELDFALILAQSGGLYRENPRLCYRHMTEDPIYLCAVDALLERCGITEEARVGMRDGVTVDRMPQLPYCIFENSIGRQVQACFEDHGLQPKRFLTDGSATTVSVQACFQGLAACFLSGTHLADLRSRIPQGMWVVPLYRQGDPVTQSLYLIWEKNRYLPRFERDFIDLLAEQFAKG